MVRQMEEQIFHRQVVKKLMAGAVLNENEDNGIFNFDGIPLHQKELGKLATPYMDEMKNEEKLKELCVENTLEDINWRIELNY